MIIEIYASKAALEKAGICHRNTVDRFLDDWRLAKTVVKGWTCDGKEFYIVTQNLWQLFPPRTSKKSKVSPQGDK